MFKVGIIGPECSGKSTLARYLAKRYQGVYVPEYGRTYLEQKGSKDVCFEEVCTIARHQIEELSAFSIQPSDKVYFFDTELIVTKVWFDYAFGHVPAWLEEAIRRYPMNVYLLTRPDIPWVEDPTRSNGSDAIREELFARYEAKIEALGIPYYIIEHA